MATVEEGAHGFRLPQRGDLAQREARNVEVYARWNENSFSAKNRAQAGESRPIGRDQFIWDPTTQGYRCPQGHSLTYSGRTTKQKAKGSTSRWRFTRRTRPTARSARSRTVVCRVNQELGP